MRIALPAPSVSFAYLFLMAALLFGFPLLTAYYNVDSRFYFSIIVPYLAVSIAIGFSIIKWSKPEESTISTLQHKKMNNNNDPQPTNFIAKLNSSFPIYGIIILVSASMLMYSLIRYLVIVTYPFPAPLATLNQLGMMYIAILLVTSILVFSRIFYSLIPSLCKILQEKKYAIMALITSVSFAIVYLVLVNQLIISGFNALGTVPPPGGSYPFSSAMVSDPRNPLIDLVYLPIMIVQLSPQVNLIFMPFEIVFVTILSLLISSNIVIAHFLISNSGLKCSTKGTLMSTGGSILGLTATCPTCLAPTFISVIFGGVTAAAAIYSNLYGVVLPPVLSVAALILSLAYLTNSLKKRGP